MRLLALWLVVQTLVVPVVPWTMMLCEQETATCDEGSCCMTSCCMSDMAEEEAPAPAEEEERDPCEQCPFVACICCVVPMPSEPVLLSVALPGQQHLYGSPYTRLLTPPLDECWHPPNGMNALA